MIDWINRQSGVFRLNDSDRPAHRPRAENRRSRFLPQTAVVWRTDRGASPIHTDPRSASEFLYSDLPRTGSGRHCTGSGRRPSPVANNPEQRPVLDRPVMLLRERTMPSKYPYSVFCGGRGAFEERQRSALGKRRGIHPNSINWHGRAIDSRRVAEPRSRTSCSPLLERPSGP
jgi:hypothetical protein